MLSSARSRLRIQRQGPAANLHQRYLNTHKQTSTVFTQIMDSDESTEGTVHSKAENVPQRVTV